MAKNYQKVQDTSTRLIEFYGRAATFTDVNPSSYDPATGSTAPVTEVDTIITAVLLPLKGSMTGQSLQDESLVKQTDKKALLTISVTPTLLDKITFGSETFSIVNVKGLNPGGTELFWDLVIRNG